jgi:hypothetical protein
MRKLRSLVHKPSPAMLVALLALFVALGGSSYAALRIGSEQIRNNSVRSVDLRNNGVRGADVRTNTLTGSDIKESNLRKVPAARIANRARNSDTLDGKDATDFGPRAYARVTRSGSVDATNSRGLTSANVSHPSDGVYCFSGLRFAVKNVIATVEAGGSTMVADHFIASARAIRDLPFHAPDRFEPPNIIPGPSWPENCPGTEQASVVITGANATTRPDDQRRGDFDGFYVVFN